VNATNTVRETVSLLEAICLTDFEIFKLLVAHGK
jgi:hypothetical protein